MKWSELEKIITKRGWVLLKHGGKHDVYIHPDREDVLVIERHASQEIKKGLYLRIKKQVGF